jgi:hypothetical protein
LDCGEEESLTGGDWSLFFRPAGAADVCVLGAGRSFFSALGILTWGLWETLQKGREYWKQGHELEP